MVKYYNTIINLGLYSNVNRLKHKMELLFYNIDLKNKNVLDIGGGNGLLSFYIASQQANNVVCLEPELDGSSGNNKNTFNKIASILKYYNITFFNSTFQEFKSLDKFDIVILYNSINHLNENACINLKKEDNARKIYNKYFRKLYKITADNATIIICDCSNRNFFNDIGLMNPLAKNIEWGKHQNPHIWLKLLEEEGFEKVLLKYSSFNRLGKLGNLFFGNKYFSYFLNSHFCLYVRKIKC